jgi:hypothetical protein
VDGPTPAASTPRRSSSNSSSKRGWVVHWTTGSSRRRLSCHLSPPQLQLQLQPCCTLCTTQPLAVTKQEVQRQQPHQRPHLVDQGPQRPHQTGGWMFWRRSCPALLMRKSYQSSQICLAQHLHLWLHQGRCRLHTWCNRAKGLLYVLQDLEGCQRPPPARHSCTSLVAQGSPTHPQAESRQKTA